jgi:hypothetical protein
MTTRDEDILDFDFFGEDEPPSWDEPSEPPPGPPRDRPPRGPRRPRFRSPGNLTPLLRLVGLISLAILIVVLLVVWVEGCATDRKRERYSDYMTEVAGVGNRSAQLGQDLATTLTTPALKLEDLDATLGGYVQSAENQVAQAQDIDAPGPLYNAHLGVIEALNYRANGLRGLKTTFQETADADDATVAGQQLAAQMSRFLASDIIWADSFKARAEGVISEEDVVVTPEPPTSEFVTADEVATPETLAAIWERIQGASSGETPQGLHGSGIAYTRVLPSGTDLSPDTETEILVTDQLAFEVGVEDTGDSPEVRVVVTLTIPKDTGPIVRKKTIPIIDPGETVAVRFDIGSEIPPFGEQVSVQVNVDPVQGETNTANNTVEYPVIFSL